MDDVVLDSIGATMQQTVLEQVAERLWSGSSWESVRSPHGMTNTNWLVRLDGEATPSFFVQELISIEAAAEFGIDRVIHLAALGYGSAAGVTPTTVALFDDLGVIVTSFIEAVHFPAPGEDRTGLVAEVGEILGGLHAHPFPPEVLQRRGNGFTNDVLEVAASLRAQAVQIPAGFDDMVDTLAVIAAGVVPDVLSVTHCDMRSSNLLVRDGVYLIDWEYARIEDPIYDLGSFAFHAALTAAEEEALLAAHTTTPGPAARELAKLRVYRYVAACAEVMFGMLFDAAGASTPELDYRAYALAQLNTATAIASTALFRDALSLARADRGGR